MDHRTGCILQHKSVLACLCSSHIFDIGHWKSVLILAEEQDQMRQWEALILNMKGLGSCCLRNKTEWSSLKPWSLLMSPEVQGRMRLWESFDFGHERSVFMSPEEQDWMKLFHVTWGTRPTEAVGSLHIEHERSARHLRFTEWGCGKALILGMKGLLMLLEEQDRTRLFGHDIGHESSVLMLAEEQDRMRLWEAIQPAVILDGIFYSWVPLILTSAR